MLKYTNGGQYITISHAVEKAVDAGIGLSIKPFDRQRPNSHKETQDCDRGQGCLPWQLSEATAADYHRQQDSSQHNQGRKAIPSPYLIQWNIEP